MSKPKFIKEGTYGCVHRPSLRCKDKKLNYNEKISKTLPSDEAAKELGEYVLIKNADPQAKFFLGVPENCKFNPNAINKAAVEKCSQKTAILNPQNNYDILIMSDGGDNLEDFAIKMSNQSKTPKNTKIMQQFWIESIQLLYGVKAFLDNGICHHDIKPQNIVYNVKKNRLNYIDFGLTETIKDSQKKCKDSKYEFAMCHWNFPFENILLNVGDYKEFLSLDGKKRKTKIAKWMKEYQAQFAIFFEYSMENPAEAEKRKHLVHFSDFMLNRIDNMTHDEFTAKGFGTQDSYGLALSLLSVLNQTKHLTSEKIFFRLQDLFYEMIRSNLIERIEIDEAIEKYQEIMKGSTIVASTTASAVIDQSATQLEKSIAAIVKDKSVSPKDISILADQDPMTLATTARLTRTASRTTTRSTRKSKRLASKSLV